MCNEAMPCHPFVVLKRGYLIRLDSFALLPSMYAYE
jgi:hypothetical protein